VGATTYKPHAGSLCPFGNRPEFQALRRLLASRDDLIDIDRTINKGAEVLVIAVIDEVLGHWRLLVYRPVERSRQKPRCYCIQTANDPSVGHRDLFDYSSVCPSGRSGPTATIGGRSCATSLSNTSRYPLRGPYSEDHHNRSRRNHDDLSIAP